MGTAPCLFKSPFSSPCLPYAQLAAPWLGPGLLRTVRARAVGARPAMSLPSPLSIHSLLPAPLFGPNCCRISRLFALFFCSFVILVAMGNPANC